MTGTSLREQLHWIDGRSDLGDGQQTRLILNPEHDQPVARMPAGTESDIRRAVSAAQAAFRNHQGSRYEQREHWLLRAADQLQQRSSEMIDLIIEETGSAITKAEREVQTSVKILHAAAGAARRITGQTLPSNIPGRFSVTIREPIGVVAGMTPFNVPLIKAVKHSAMPLVTGNACVLLPSEESPSAAGLLAQIYQAAGVPDGLFNVVCGNGAEIGDTLTTHEDVRLVSFTGSTRIGRHVQRLCGEHAKRVVLEMGGLNPLIVLADADLSHAVRCAVLGGFLFQGQICMASSRVFVAEEIFEPFLNAFVSAAQQLPTGDLRRPATVIGPIINVRQRDRIRRHLQNAIDGGAHVHGGNEWDGNRLLPTVLTNVAEDAQLHQEETFGPVVTVIPICTADEAIARANSTSYGLCAAVHTNDLTSAMQFSRELNFGMVHFNAATIQEEAHVPLGGVGDSGFGREGTEVSVDDLTEWKWITVQPPPAD